MAMHPTAQRDPRIHAAYLTGIRDGLASISSVREAMKSGGDDATLIAALAKLVNTEPAAPAAAPTPAPEAPKAKASKASKSASTKAAAPAKADDGFEAEGLVTVRGKTFDARRSHDGTVTYLVNTEWVPAGKRVSATFLQGTKARKAS